MFLLLLFVFLLIPHRPDAAHWGKHARCFGFEVQELLTALAVAGVPANSVRCMSECLSLRSRGVPSTHFIRETESLVDMDRSNEKPPGMS